MIHGQTHNFSGENVNGKLNGLFHVSIVGSQILFSVEIGTLNT